MSLSSGYARASLPEISIIADCATFNFTPGCNRAATLKPRAERLPGESTAAGIGAHASDWVSGGKQNPRGVIRQVCEAPDSN